MTVETKNGLKVQVDEKQKITFPQGLFGFENMTDFVLLDCEYKPFFWMQSLQEKNLSFLIVDPFLFFSDYEIDADDSILKTIDLTKPEDVKIMCIVTVPNDGSGVTINMQGPLVINKINNKAMQIILPDERYTTKHNLLEQIKNGGSAC
ncbi:MAG: flagellar assembly protein FliW [Treponema sp.]|nr:flagellar assembly protein FliW [Treponema sp.]